MSMPMGATGNGLRGGATGASAPSFSIGKSKGGYRSAQMQQFTPEQMQLFQQLFGHVGPDSFLNKLASGDQSQFEQLEAPAMQQFQGLQGQTASRFSGGPGQGTGNRHSSGFQNEMNSANQSFAQALQGQRLTLQQNAINSLRDFSGQLLGQNPYSNFLLQKDQKKGGWGGAIGAGLGAVGGFFAGGPGGALAGGQLGYNVGSKF